MLIAAVQLDIAWEDKPLNHKRIERLLDDATLPGGCFVVLPELCDTGFSFDLDAIVDDRSIQWARQQAMSRNIWVQVGHATRAEDRFGRNCCAIIRPDGSIAGEYQKIHPFSFGREAEHYRGGNHLLIADCNSARIAPLICYDLRFPELWRLAARRGTEVFTLGASWPSARQHHWRALAIARAIENQAFVIAVNRVGTDPHLEYEGGSIIVSPHGEVLAEADDHPAVLVADLDLEDLRSWRKTFPALDDIHADTLGDLPIHEA